MTQGEDESIDGELLQNTYTITLTSLLLYILFVIGALLEGASLEILISKLHPDMKFYNFNLGYNLNIY
ncbi:hypothetical protein Bca4012_067561 [Brassica carinata]